MRKISIIIILLGLILIPNISGSSQTEDTKTKPELKIKNNIGFIYLPTNFNY